MRGVAQHVCSDALAYILSISICMRHRAVALNRQINVMFLTLCYYSLADNDADEESLRYYGKQGWEWGMR